MSKEQFLVRTEELKFTLCLDEALATKYKDEIGVFINPPVLVDDDELTINYTLHINYNYYGVLKRLTAIETLLSQPGIIKFANVEKVVEEVKYGRSLAYELFTKLDRIANTL
jgi:uncharacterized membrane protein